MSKTVTPAELINEYNAWTVQAPMVRYSKQPFRELCASYNTHITYTPMMLSKEFARSEFARAADFSTSNSERAIFNLSRRKSNGEYEKTTEPVRGCLIAQFAANEAVTFSQSAELIAAHVDAIDLNTGCPTQWAYEEGIGSALLRKPEVVADIVKTTYDRVGSKLPITVKIRIDKEERRTEQLIKNAVMAGASIIGIHGRYRTQSSTTPVNLDGIALARSFSSVPTISNGDAWSLEQSLDIKDKTGCNGVMSARGLLANPAMFAGYEETPIECIDRFIDLSMSYGLQFPLFHRHIYYMLESKLSKSQRQSWHNVISTATALEWIEEYKESVLY